MPDHGNSHNAKTSGPSNHERMFRQKFWISTLLSIPVLVYSETVQGWLGYTLPDFQFSGLIVPVFSIIVFYIGGLPFFRMSRGELKDKKPGMTTLISLALAVDFIYSLASTFFDLGNSFFGELVTLIDVMLLGHWIEMRSVRKASGALSELSKLLPDEANRIKDEGEVETVKVSELEVGDVVLVRPGESVPADGKIIEGESTMDESMITGESKPVPKEKGDDVVSGTINGDGSLRIKVKAVGEETTLAGIMCLVEEAQQSKSRTQIFADRAAGWLFYIALGVAVLTAIGWLIAVGWDMAILNLVTSVLVTACSHALGLDIPLVVAISTSIGASNGILVRDRVAMVLARNLDIFVFDKTGTLTKGEFGLEEMLSAGEVTDDQALALAAALERDSEHPIARAIRMAGEDRDLDIPDASGFEAIKGKGIRTDVGGKTYFVGCKRLLAEEELSLEGEIASFSENANEKGMTVVYLLFEKQIMAAFSLADQIREKI
jgi:P-type Cu2+ transporter